MMEFTVSGFCPYCKRSFNMISHIIGSNLSYQCVECQRGLTVIILKDGAHIEPGTSQQVVVDIHTIKGDCH